MDKERGCIIWRYTLVSFAYDTNSNLTNFGFLKKFTLFYCWLLKLKKRMHYFDTSSSYLETRVWN